MPLALKSQTFASSAIIALALVIRTWPILKGYKAAWPGPFPTRVWVNLTVVVVIVFGLLANTGGYLIEPSIAPIAIAATQRLIMGIDIFLHTVEGFLEGPG
jgi:hypothetical protein